MYIVKGICLKSEINWCFLFFDNIYAYNES